MLNSHSAAADAPRRPLHPAAAARRARRAELVGRKRRLGQGAAGQDEPHREDRDGPRIRPEGRAGRGGIRRAERSARHPAPHPRQRATGMGAVDGRGWQLHVLAQRPDGRGDLGPCARGALGRGDGRGVLRKGDERAARPGALRQPRPHLRPGLRVHQRGQPLPPSPAPSPPPTPAPCGNPRPCLQLSHGWRCVRTRRTRSWGL